MAELELSDMLVKLREELKTAQEKAKDEDLQFKLEDVEVEVQFTVSKQEMTEGGVKYVFNVSVGEEKATQTMHKLKLKMTPETAAGGDVKVSSGKTKKPK